MHFGISKNRKQRRGVVDRLLYHSSSHICLSFVRTMYKGTYSIYLFIYNVRYIAACHVSDPNDDNQTDVQVIPHLWPNANYLACSQQVATEPNVAQLNT